MMEPIKLDLGCGHAKREGFLGIDCFKGDQVDMVIDLFGTLSHPPDKIGVSQTEGLENLLEFFGEDTVDYIHSHHTIEHCPWKTVYRVINGWVKALKPGGTILLTCPDLGWLCNAYVNGDWDIRYEHEHGNLLPAVFGNNLDEGHFEGLRHAGGFDYKLLHSYLTDMGMTNIRRLKQSEFVAYATWELAIKAEKADDTSSTE